MLIICAVTAQLICDSIFAYAKSRFSHEAGLMMYRPEKQTSGVVFFLE